MAKLANKRSVNGRVKDVLWAAFVAALLAFIQIADPVNQMVWVYQSLISQKPMSGDTVFATSDESLAAPGNPKQRVLLAKRLREIGQSDVAHVYIDVVFDRPSTPDADAELTRAIAGLGDRVSLVWRLAEDYSGRPEGLETLPAIAGDATQIATNRVMDYLGYTWRMSPSVELDGQTQSNLPVAMAGSSPRRSGDFEINYGFDPATLPVIDLDRVLSPDDLATIDGKQLVIGGIGDSSRTLAYVPGMSGVPGTYIFIYAAETLKSAPVVAVANWAALGAYFLALLLVVWRGGRKSRPIHLGYLVLGLSIPIGLWVTALADVRVGYDGVLIFLTWFAALRFRARWQKKFALQDAKTGLPTFRAFEKALFEEGNPPAIIVAKIHSYEEVMKTLPANLHADYVRGLLGRFRTVEKNLRIYANEGKYFAWSSAENHTETLETHLDGLRALFASPVVVGGVEVDVRITFGIDLSGEPDPVQRMASAISAAEDTDEAHRPINFASLDEKSDALWKLSLQARIDNALENEEIYLVFQPKMDLRSGEIIGWEALVRWNDPARGLISPAYFVQECERAGRIDHLTEYVLSHAARVGRELHDIGYRGTISVNISAVLLRGNRVERMVQKVIDESGISADMLMLEVTETARIVDLEQAVVVLRRLRAMHIAVSIDDFGAGAANLETIYRLPFDELKIDRVFVADLKNPKARAIVESVLAFGRATGAKVVAEGVEDPESMNILNELGCPIVQGYGISKPMESDKMIDFLNLSSSERKKIMV